MAYRILSFCGGGVRGYMSAIILNRLNHAFHERHGVWLTSRADCIAGTSTGSFITAMLLCDVPTADIVAVYRDFVAPACAKAKQDPTQPALGSLEFINILDDLGLDRRLRDFPRNAVFTSFDLGGEDRPWSPQLLHNFRGSTTSDFGVLDAVAASGAMPGISRPYTVTVGGRTYNLVDGAFVHHDPTIPAVALAAGSGIPVGRMSALDIGTGFMRNFLTADASGWGSQQWLHGSGGKDGQLPPLLVNTPDDPANEMPILNLTLNGTSTSLMPDLAKMLLGDRFAYLNPDFGARVVGELSGDPHDLDFLEEKAASCDLEPALGVLERHWLW